VDFITIALNIRSGKLKLVNKNQNDLDWKGPLEVTCFKSPFKAGSALKLDPTSKFERLLKVSPIKILVSPTLRLHNPSGQPLPSSDHPQYFPKSKIFLICFLSPLGVDSNIATHIPSCFLKCKCVLLFVQPRIWTDLLDWTEAHCRDTSEHGALLSAFPDG